jgi:hypothetical protein
MIMLQLMICGRVELLRTIIERDLNGASEDYAKPFMVGAVTYFLIG